MLFNCCLIGRFQEPDRDCLAEAVLKAPGGPVACYAASTRSAPYGNAVMGKETIEAFFAGNHGRLGDLVVESKKRLLAVDDGLRKTIHELSTTPIRDRDGVVGREYTMGDVLDDVKRIGGME